MNRKRLVMLLMVLLCTLWLAQVTLAMSSTNYKLDWFTPLTSGGGGAAGSTNYAIDLTVGQAAIGASSSANYAAGLGYWYGVGQQFMAYLPIVVK